MARTPGLGGGTGDDSTDTDTDTISPPSGESDTDTDTSDDDPDPISAPRGDRTPETDQGDPDGDPIDAPRGDEPDDTAQPDPEPDTGDGGTDTDTSEPQTPEGTPPEPDKGPSPDPDTEGPSIPSELKGDLTQEQEQDLRQTLEREERLFARQLPGVERDEIQREFQADEGRFRFTVSDEGQEDLRTAAGVVSGRRRALFGRPVAGVGLDVARRPASVQTESEEVQQAAEETTSGGRIRTFVSEVGGDVAAGSGPVGRTTPGARPGLEQIRRERAVEQLESELTSRFGRAVEAGEDFTVERTNDGFEARMTGDLGRGAAEERLTQSLSEQTGVELSDEDVAIREEDGELTATLSDQGERKVARETVPLGDAPVVGGAFETGADVRVRYEQATDPIAEGFEERTPDKEDVFGPVPNFSLPNVPLGTGSGLAAAAGAGVVAPEPVTTGTGALILGGLAAGAITADVARRADIGDGVPTAQARGEIEVPEEGTTVAPEEIAVPEDGEPVGRGNIGVPEEGEPVPRREIAVPEEPTTVQPEELGIPREVVQEGRVDVTGPEGTDVTEDGEIVIPLGATQVARQTRFEDEEEEEEEEEDEEEEEEDEEVTVVVPEEFIPEEGQVIGEEGTEAAEEDFVAEPEEPTEEAEEDEEEDIEPIQLPRQRQAEDDAEPEDTRTDEAFGRFGEEETELTAAEDAVGRTLGEGAFPTTVGGSATDTLPIVGGRETEQTTDVAQGGPQPRESAIIGERETEAEVEVTATGDILGTRAGTQVGQADAVADLVGEQTGVADAVAVADATAVADLDLDLQQQQQPQFEQPVLQEETTVNEPTTPANQFLREQLQQQTTVDPTAPRQARNMKLPRLDLPGGDRDDEEDEFGRAEAPILTDFLDPLTGEVRETDEDPSDDPFIPGIEFPDL